jgi:hypothetical protein
MPGRFRDDLPQALPLLPPTTDPVDSNAMPLASSLDPTPSVPIPRSSPTSSLDPDHSAIRKFFRTPRNVFGLLRQYLSERAPSHDPAENITLQDLTDEQSNIVEEAEMSSPPNIDSNSFFPYPNESSFCLGDWYWNGGVQKSKESFRQLLKVMGSSTFHPEDVRHKQWDDIDALLGKNDFDGKRLASIEVEEGWLDEDVGWRKEPIVISVPFHHRTKNPGVKDYVVGDLYHRSIVSIIREKLTNPNHAAHFHYDPFELYWKPTETSPDICVHGELYSSPAFLNEHTKLQNSPGEPGCSLPRVVVGLIFSSDSMCLTSFGTKKL